MRILFICHEASRIGSPKVLLELMGWLKANTDFEIDVLLKIGGELEYAFVSTADNTFKWNHYRPKWQDSFRSHLHDAFIVKAGNRLRKTLLLPKLRSRKYDVVYANTALSSDVMLFLNKVGIARKFIMHVHDLYSITSSMGEHFHKAAAITDHFISVSKVSTQNLIENYNISSDKISTIYPFSSSVKPDSLKNIRKQYSIPNDTFLVGGCGILDWRKGPDLFLSVAASALKSATTKPLYFLWLGNNKHPKHAKRFIHDAQSISKDNRIIFAGAQDNPQDYFAAFDLFLLTSREDPFPLVCLENAQAGVPIICFNQHNGCTEYVDNTCGAVVDYLNVEEMKKSVLEYANSPQKHANASENIKQHSSKYTLDISAPQILDIINKFA